MYIPTFLRLLKVNVVIGFGGLILSSMACVGSESASLRVMILTGQMNRYHSWEVTSKVLQSQLEETGLFEVDLVVAPPMGEDMTHFRPDFSAYEAVVIVYDGDDWPPDTREAFIEYVKQGGGVVTVHSTNNAFVHWKEWNDVIGVGGWGGSGAYPVPMPERLKTTGGEAEWGGRNQKHGPIIRWRHGEMVQDDGPGGTFHPPKHDFLITVRDYDHPVTQGLPETWYHAFDECYSRLRGPAENLSILATGFANPAVKNASMEHEPVLMAIRYGEGRVFHSTLGHVGKKDEHPVRCLQCVGFSTTFQRGTEWAASGKVTQPVPEDFPTAYEVSERE